MICFYHFPGPCAVLWVSPDEPWPLWHLHRRGRVAFTGTRSSQDLCRQPAGQAQPWMFRGRRKPQVHVHPGICNVMLLFFQGGLKYSIDIPTKLQHMWCYGFLPLQSRAAPAGVPGQGLTEKNQNTGSGWGNSCCRPGDRHTHPINNPHAVWRLHCSDNRSPPQHHNGLHQVCWNNILSETRKEVQYIRHHWSAKMCELHKCFFIPMTYSLTVKWKVSFQTPRTCNNHFSLFVTCRRQNSSPPFLRK